VRGDKPARMRLQLDSTLDKLAARGLTYTQWHTTALYSKNNLPLAVGVTRGQFIVGGE
jgi:hypothetical protein